MKKEKLTLKNTETPKSRVNLLNLHCCYWTPVYPRGSYVITPVSLSVRPSVCLSVFKDLRDHALVFSNFFHEVRVP